MRGGGQGFGVKGCGSRVGGWGLGIGVKGRDTCGSWLFRVKGPSSAMESEEPYSGREAV